MPLVTKPKPLIDANDICPFWQGERAPRVRPELTEVVCEQILFAGRIPEFPRRNEPLFTREIFHEVFDRVERAQQYVKRGVIEDMHETFARIDLADHEGAGHNRKVTFPRVGMIVSDETGNDHQAAAVARGAPTSSGRAVRDDIVRRQPIWRPERAGGSRGW